MPASFIPGLELSERFYSDAVAPLLDRHFPGLPHAAARLGSGSEVLGYDTTRSADHEWGPRLQLFLTEEDNAQHGPRISQLFSERLPKVFLGYPTNFASTGDGGVGEMRLTDGPVGHRVEVTDAASWFAAHLGFDPVERELISTLDWLATPWQRLLEFTAGAIFRDDLTRITPARRLLQWYPSDIERYILACQWRRIAQEEAFPGRCAEVGDDLGSAIVTSRISRDIMRLCLLLHRQYPPYSKWLGSAFARLPGIAGITASLTAAQRATNWGDREDHLVAAYEQSAAIQNNSSFAVTGPTTTSSYFDRPFRVIHADRFANALLDATASDVSRLPMIGSVDQWVDSTDAAGQLAELRHAVQARLELAND